jgi:NADPH-dependent 2,4-dienoyl-CoA reductase/sulfur reductase-like enzyme
MSKSAGPDNDTEWGRALERPVDTDGEARPGNTTSIEHVQVAVVGGGLAGLAVAIGLSRQGFDVKVYERAPELRSRSQGILGLQ